MDHINSYFINTNKTILKRNKELDLVVSIINDLTGIVLKNEEITIKKETIHLNIFGVKRTHILSFKKNIIEKLLKDYGIIITEIK